LTLILSFDIERSALDVERLLIQYPAALFSAV